MATLNMPRVIEELRAVDRNISDGNYDRAIIEIEVFKGRLDTIITWLRNNKK